VSCDCLVGYSSCHSRYMGAIATFVHAIFLSVCQLKFLTFLYVNI
jgi:hypothetical protein